MPNLKILLTVLLTVVACSVVGVAGASGFIHSGIYDVSALTPDTPFVKCIAGRSL